jgi:UDP-glucose 6-dehydrogenase
VCNATKDHMPKIIVEKSTVPVKTADAMAAVMAAACTGTNFQVREWGEMVEGGGAIWVGQGRGVSTCLK